MLKYYSVVANPSTSCRGMGNWYGKRYIEVANMLGNSNIDICTTELKDALTQISSNLITVKANFRKKYLVIGSAPNIASIKVTKYSSGGTVELPQDGSNGWTFEGTVADVQSKIAGLVYAIDSPIPMDLITSGYIIELHGSEKLSGNDSADVNYQNAGTVTSH